MYQKYMESLGFFILPKEGILEIKVEEMASKPLLPYITM